MPRLSRNDLERISERVYAAYRKLPEIANQKILRISPELMLKLVGLKIEHCRLSVSGNIAGVTCSSGQLVRIYDCEDEQVYFCLDGSTILVDKELHDDESLKLATAEEHNDSLESQRIAAYPQMTKNSSPAMKRSRPIIPIRS